MPIGLRGGVGELIRGCSCRKMHIAGLNPRESKRSSILLKFHIYTNQRVLIESLILYRFLRCLLQLDQAVVRCTTRSCVDRLKFPES